jgi:catechol 2,3-dioxygenase-like lactoylglutathione lyase family enzyme
MINAMTHTQVWVLDQDEALEFYVGKLGLEVHTDADIGTMRWLTVNVPGEPEERFYGTDCALRDPFGNPIRISEPAPGP